MFPGGCVLVFHEKFLNKKKTWTDSREVAVSRILKGPNQPPKIRTGRTKEEKKE